MRQLAWGSFPTAPKSILFLGAHCDDIEIGCGATILRLARQYPEISIYWVVFSSNEERAKEASSAAKTFLNGVESKVIIRSFRNGYFPWVGDEIKTYFETLKTLTDPDVIFTHYRKDLHQDHRIIGELTWNTFRDHLILEYEIPKYDGGLGAPNVFFPVGRKDVQKKIDILMKYYSSQHNKVWFTEDTFRGLMRIRGIESNADEGFSEAFYCSKLVI